MTPRPPPCMELNSQNSSLTSRLSCVTWVSKLTPLPLLPDPVPDTRAKTSWAAPTGYEAVILSLPWTADFRTTSSVCSLSLIVADLTFESANWASAVEVETCWYPPLPRKKEEDTTARTMTRPIQNQTERKIFLRSIHRCREPGYRPTRR